MSSEWSRWGRGMCEGWSLEIGTAYRGAVVRQDHIDQPPTNFCVQKSVAATCKLLRSAAATILIPSRGLCLTHSNREG
jgi:hypothetical protein